MSNTTPPPQPRRPVVVTTPLALQDTGPSPAKVIAVCAVSAVLNALVILMFTLVAWLFSLNVGSGSESEIRVLPTAVEDTPKELDLTVTEVGLDSLTPLNFDVNRIEDVSVTGPVDPTAPVGLHNAPEAAAKNVPPLPGFGGGTGLALKDLDKPGTGSMFGLPGGDGGIYIPGGFTGRSGATREKLVADFGGNALSEAAVARGLEWLSLHQANDGHWSLHDFPRHAREKPLPGLKTFVCDCVAGTNRKNDIAATAFGVLPFLGAGITHKPPAGKAPQKDYTRTVHTALHYLMNRQNKDGYFGGDAYAHALASIALCEAYGLTSDPLLKASAQKAVNYIVSAQDPAGGGWRYSPKQAPGDLSVTGWELMALKSAQMSGLAVPSETLKKCELFLNSVESTSRRGQFSYLPDNSAPTSTMTAVGLLCRQYMGINPRNPALLDGVKVLMDNPPGKTKNQYYEYYATQVMHHMGGDSWQFWNLGPEGKGTGGIRDTLIAKQDKGTDAKHGHQAGSFAVDYPDEGGRAFSGGRIMATSLSILSLEVYYRHLPLYRREMALSKDEAK
jgi:hypothetical protein